MNLRRISLVVLILFIFFCPYLVAAAEMSLENDIQKAIEQSRGIIKKAKEKLNASESITDEITQLKTISEKIKTSHILLQERFALREQTAQTLGAKAVERHSTMSAGYKQALEEYLSLVDSLPPSEIGQSAEYKVQSLNQDQIKTLNSVLETLHSLLDRILPKKKKPIFGSLPYKNLKYPSKEPDSTSPAIKPAYKGGNKIVSPDDTKSTEEAPISVEIATLAQSLNWNPVSIYEYVKNNIETEWYRGCMKGAEETLRQKSGNDCDQAALFAALLRASGFPTRFVRGTMEFFPDISSIKNNLGIDDPLKIAEFLQKAGMPFKPVIAGGKITNFQIEHIWIESQIPYGNYRGAIIDNSEKKWLGLDTSIKVEDYLYNNPIDIFQQSAISSQLSAIRDEYLGAVQTQTPLEYLETKLTTGGYQLSDLMLTKTLVPERLTILPLGTQFVEKKITHEYTQIPEELKHKVRFRATTQNSELLNIELSTMDLANKQIAITYEPETVEDQEIINSYGGLDNTPAYLVRLRPVLKIGGQRTAISTDGLPMGSEYELTIELYSPSVNGGATKDNVASGFTPVEKITNTHIVGNLAAIGIVSQKAISAQQSAFSGQSSEADSSQLTAESLLYQEALSYIDRWNKAEDEFASLMHLTIARPLPTVVTIGGVIDVTYLLDTPHGFTWKGVFMDADLRTIETVQSSEVGVQSERQKTFMQLSGLQGSILENRIFEDDFQVQAISTAKLLSLSNSGQIPIFTIDSSNINTIMPSLSFDENVKEDIINSVNQGLTIRIPNSEIIYQDWTGVGYIKEDLNTGESGYMLSGIIAGGMTAWGLDKWPAYYLERLINPYSEPPNYDPLSAKYIQKVTKTDLQNGTVGEKLPQALQVLVHDNKMKPVKNVNVTFTVKAGEGNLSGKDASGQQITGTTVTVPTDFKGIASIWLTLGQKTSANPTFWWEDGYTYTQQVGENIVDASLPLGTSISKPFSSLGFPNTETASIRQTHGNAAKGLILSFAGFIALAIEDNYGNPISNIPVDFKSLTAVDKSTCSNPNADTTRNYALLVKTDNPCIKNAPAWGECGDPVSQNKVNIITDSTGAAAEVILGGIPEADYPIKATATVNIKTGAKTLETSFALATYPFGNCDGNQEPSNQLFIQYVYTADTYGNNINAGKVGTTIPVTAKMFYLKEGETEKETTLNCNTGTLTCKKIIGNRQYSIDTNFKASTVTFSGQPATLQGGIFTANYTLSSGLNNIIISGTATTGIKKINNSCDTGCGVVKDEDLTQSSSATMKVYGVDLKIDSIPLILIDENGYTKQDNSIKYTIAPLEYQALTAYVMLYKNGEIIVSIPAETKGQGTAVISRGFQFDVNSKYEVEVVLNYATGVEIRSDKMPLKLIHFKIVKPTATEKILIKNDTDGNPKMQTLTAQVELKGSGIEPGLLDLTNKKICWQFKVEYIVNTKAAPQRSRKGLDPSGAGQGKDGYLIPSVDPNDPTNDCITKQGATFVVDENGNNGAKWDNNFGGGILEITAKTTINGAEVSDAYVGKIEGESFSDAFKTKLTAYLENPKADETAPTIRTEVGYDKFFRVIAYLETRYRHFYPSIYGDPKNAMYPRENSGGDGGFGVMQLTEDSSLQLNNLPSYKQIWDWKENVNCGVEVLRGKLAEAKAYPVFVRTTGCVKPPKKLANGKTVYYCFPLQTKDPDATDFNTKYLLKMDTYSLWNSGWHYWKWMGKKNGGWQPRLPKGAACGDVPNGSCYADEGESIEKNPPNDF